MNNRIVLRLNYILGAVTILCVICYKIVGPIWIKGLASAFFLLTGLINLVFALKSDVENKAFSIIIFTGLFFCFVADIVLELVFIAGAAIFAAGHICFFVAYCKWMKLLLRDIFISLGIFVIAVCILVFVPFFDYGSGTMMAVAVIYSLFLSFLLGKAISNYRSERSGVNLILLIGSALFFFSDTMLLIDTFTAAPKLFLYLCDFIYYPSALFLAHSIYVQADSLSEKQPLLKNR
ncbi:MAG: lysoplasmalogenase family protein [Lachnospiraceae bacterium]|jgi:hypothetical protein